MGGRSSPIREVSRDEGASLNPIDQTEMIFQVELPEHLSDERVSEWLASGMRDGWSDTIDRLVASFAAVAGRS